MKLVVTEFITLDGGFESPEQWSFPYWGDDISAFKERERQSADALLLGRRTFEGFAAAWPGRDGAFAERMNSLPKHVATRAKTLPPWQNSHRLEGDLESAVRGLKAQPGRDLLVDGSGSLVQTLLAAGLVDRLTLLVYPLILGQERRRLLDLADTARMKLLGHEAFASGVVALDLAPA